MNEELSNKILERLDADKITPISRLHFQLLRWLFWLFAILSIIVGSIAVGAILFLFNDHRRHGFFVVSHKLIEFLLAVPFIWIIIFALFVWIAEISIKHTKKGYRYRFRPMFSIIIILSIIFGLLLNFIRTGESTHDLLNQNFIYNYVVYDSKDDWDRPIIGRLAGTVLSIEDEDNFSIIDFGGHIWQVRLATSTDDDLSLPEASSTVRMFGFIDPASNIFISESMSEWED